MLYTGNVACMDLYKLSFRNHVLLREWALTLVLGHRPLIYTCLVRFSVRICQKRIWGMIFMILSPVGGSRTLCILLLYTMSIYKGKRFDETGILDIKCHAKKTETGQVLHMQVLMSSTILLRLFPSRWDHLLCQKLNEQTKQTNKQNTKIATTTTILTHLSKRKVSPWRNFQPEGTMKLNFPRRAPLSIMRPEHTLSKKSLSPQQYLWSSTPSITVILLGSM